MPLHFHSSNEVGIEVCTSQKFHKRKIQGGGEMGREGEALAGSLIDS